MISWFHFWNDINRKMTKTMKMSVKTTISPTLDFLKLRLGILNMLMYSLEQATCKKYIYY